ncbi:MAG: 4-phosphopantetheinyl transferase family protein [Deltaproteobacteria bacterium]|nr:4-phosphopantetheinyl transferase family protein [Deltaproteobacteria bacterium]
MVGNDVVDLADPEVRSGPAHPRFDARVFAPVEREALRTSGEPNRLRWMLWAAKEAAYKLLKKCDPKLAFSPARFVVALDGSLRGEVVHAKRTLCVSLRTEADALHAVATNDAHYAARVVSAVGVAPEPLDPSTAVRALAVRTLAERLGLPSTAFRLGRRARIPTLEVAGLAAPLDLSLSHHGRFVAFASVLGGAAAA